MSLSPCKGTSLHCLHKVAGHVSPKSAYCPCELQQALCTCCPQSVYLLTSFPPPKKDPNTPKLPKPQNFHKQAIHHFADKDAPE